MTKFQRETFIEAAASYVLEHGFAGLSLRPLARALGTSDRMLVYHFGSKETLVRDVMERLSTTFAAQVVATLSGPASVGELARELWRVLTAPAAVPYLRAYLELFALSLHEPALYGETVREITESWVKVLAGAIGTGDEARERAALILGTLDGLFIFRQATGDAVAADAAIERFASMWDPANPRA